MDKLNLNKPTQHVDGRRVLRHHLVPEWACGSHFNFMLQYEDGAVERRYVGDSSIINVPEPANIPIMRSEEGVCGMTRKQTNEEIARMLGFKEHKVKINHEDSDLICWEYPERYSDLVTESPMYDCPDFVRMIDNYIKIKQIIRPELL